MMLSAKIVFIVSLLLLAFAWGSGRQGQGFGGGHQMVGGFQGRSGGQFGSGQFGGQNFGGSGGRNGRQFGGEQDFSKYRTNLFNDDDVYGYDASYPNGEAAYINYKTKEARSRRGPEFARTSRAYSRQGGAGGGQSFGGQGFGGHGGFGGSQQGGYGRGQW